MRYIRFKKEKQQINFLNCAKPNKWIDTCQYREGGFEDVCDGECECDERHYLDIEGRILLEHNYAITYQINNISYTSRSSPLITTLEELGISEWTVALKMFYGCTNLTSVISLPSTSNVVTMDSMFKRCTNLTSLNLSSFDTSNVTTMYDMFYNCSGLTSLDLSSFDTSKVTNMGGMFEFCGKLTSLDLSSFDTSNVTTMLHMFNACSGLTSLDLSGWDTSNVTDMEGMFNYCTSLKTIYMRECDSNTISQIENALTEANIRDNVTIIT